MLPCMDALLPLQGAGCSEQAAGKRYLVLKLLSQSQKAFNQKDADNSFAVTGTA